MTCEYRRDMPHPELDGVLRRLRWAFGFRVRDWDRECWVVRT